MTATKRNLPFLVLLIIAGEAIFFLPFVLPRIFRHTILEFYAFTDFELGSAFSAYGIVAIASYFFGGPLADKFSPRVLIGSALCLTALGGLAFQMDMSHFTLVLVYGYWGFTTIFLLWAAMIKATRVWGGHGFQGRAFGFLEAGRGLTSAIMGALALFVLSMLATDLSGNNPMRIDIVILASSIFIFCIGLIILRWMPSLSNDSNDNSIGLQFKEVILLLKNRKIWLQGFIIVFAYTGYKMTDDFSLFAYEVLHFDQIESASVGTTALWLRPLFALIAGLAADRLRVFTVIGACFSFMILGGALIFTGLLDQMVLWVLGTMVFTVIGIYGLRGVYFAAMEDINIPIASTGTAVGIMSILGYTPDVFISPTMGWILDAYPGAQGHHYVFGIVAAAGMLGLITTLWLNRIKD